MSWAKLVAKHIDSKIRDLLTTILFRILFMFIPSSKVVAGMLRQGYDQFRITMQEHAKGMSDADLNESLEDIQHHRSWPGKLDELREEMEKAGLTSVIIEALENEKFLREFDTPHD